MHPSVIPNLCKQAQLCEGTGFNITLLTNIDYLSDDDLQILQQANVTVADHSILSSSTLYSHFLSFFEKGMSGDKSAFALASDILRMAALQLADDDKYFIYADPNDVELIDLNRSLQNLDAEFQHNSFGFSYFIEQIQDKIFHVRNDVLIAKKNINPIFFENYLEYYFQHLEKNVKSYVKPKTDKEAVRRETLI